MRMSRYTRMAIICLLAFSVVELGVMFGLQQYMAREAEADVREIAQVHLKGVSGEEVNHFNVIQMIRFEELRDFRTGIDRMDEPTPREIASTIRRIAANQRLISCVLVTESGEFVHIEGARMISYDDSRYVLEHLRRGESFLTGGYSEQCQVVIYAAAFEAPMENGEMSIGLLCMREVDAFETMIDLSDESTLVSYQLLRNDGSFLVRNRESLGSTFYDTLKACATLDNGESIDGEVRAFKAAIQGEEDHLTNIIYTYENGVSERRCLYGTPLPHSNLYLLTVMPYGGVLDNAIEDMGRSRAQTFMLTLGMLTLGLVLTLAFFIRSSLRQMRALDAERSIAEEASARAEEEAQDAMHARSIAEEAMVELEAAKDEAIRARDEADRANRAKSEFLSKMSHEIRTPINTMLGMDEMILWESGEPVIREYAENIHDAGEILLNQVNTILDLSKIERGQLDIVERAYDTRAMLNRAGENAAAQARKKGIAYHAELDDELPQALFGDDTRIGIILTSLLNNAIKYTKTGTVTLSVGAGFPQEGICELAVAVRDTGTGMEQEELERVYRQLRHVGEEENTGLGIATSQALLERMGSTLEVESESGKGSVFSFRLRQKVLSRDVVGAYQERRSTRGRRRQDRQILWAPKADVLVVDDNDMNLKVAGGLMKHYGIIPDLASSGEACLKRVQTKRYDIVFMDHMMPDMDGITTFRRMREENLVQEGTAVIVLTANAVVGMRESYLEEGFTDYLSKPIDISALESMFEKYLPREKVSYHSAGGGAAATAKAEAAALRRLAEAGCNVRAGLQYAAGDAEFYQELLRNFCSGAAENIRQMDRLLSQNDLANYGICVHTLKSGARTIGANRLSELAFAQESAVKERRAEDIRSGHGPLVDCYLETEAQIRKALRLTEEPPEAERKGAPAKAEISAAALKQKLEEAEEKLRMFETESAAALLNELIGGTCRGEPMDKMLSETMKLIDRYETTEAAERLRALARQLNETQGVSSGE